MATTDFKMSFDNGNRLYHATSAPVSMNFGSVYSAPSHNYSAYFQGASHGLSLGQYGGGAFATQAYFSVAPADAGTGSSLFEYMDYKEPMTEEQQLAEAQRLADAELGPPPPPEKTDAELLTEELALARKISNPRDREFAEVQALLNHGSDVQANEAAKRLAEYDQKYRQPESQYSNFRGDLKDAPGIVRVPSHVITYPVYQAGRLVDGIISLFD